MSYISNLIEGNYLLIRSALIIIIIILLVTLFVVFLKNFRKPRKEQRVLRRGVDNNLQRIEKLRHLNKDPGEKLLLLDNIVLAYLSGIVKINKKEGYEKISRKLKEGGDLELADFCNKMEYYLYGNAKIEKESIDSLILEFGSLISPIGLDIDKRNKIENDRPKYLEIAEEIRNSSQNPRQKLLLLDNLVRTYFVNSFNMGKKDSYKKISRKMLDSGELELADFCRKMQHYIQGYVEINSNKIEGLIIKFRNLLGSKTEDIYNKKPEEKTEQKSVKKIKGEIKRKIEIPINKSEPFKKPRAKSLFSGIKGFFIKNPREYTIEKKKVISKGDYKKDQEIMKLRKLWYPDE